MVSSNHKWPELLHCGLLPTWVLNCTGEKLEAHCTYLPWNIGSFKYLCIHLVPLVPTYLGSSNHSRPQSNQPLWISNPRKPDHNRNQSTLFSTKHSFSSPQRRETKTAIPTTQMLSRVTFRRTALPLQLQLPQRTCAAQRSLATTARLYDAHTPIKKAETTPELKREEDSLGLAENEERGISQAPNRKEVWSRSQRPRAAAMSGPRFEQTDFSLQVRHAQIRFPFFPPLSLFGPRGDFQRGCRRILLPLRCTS